MPEAFATGAGAGALAAGIKAVQDAADSGAVSQAALAAAEERDTASTLDDAKAKYLLAMAQRMQANTARDAADANAAAGAAAGNAAYGWGVLTRNFRLFGGALGTGALGAVAGWHIALDAAFESAVALGTALAALAVGVAAMTPAAQDIYTHLTAVHDVSVALQQTIPPLNGWFEKLQHQMAPQTAEAYGGALSLVNSQGTILSQVAGQVVTGIDDWIAKLDLWMQGQSASGKLLQDGVGFLHQFGTAVDDVGVALHNLINADPGTAHYLMDIVVGATKVLDVITELPPPILMAGLALHSFWLWGGLMATGVTNLLGPLRSLSLALGGVKAEETAVTALSKDASGLQVLKATILDVGAGFAAYGRNVATAVSEAEGLGKVSAGLGAAFSFINPVVVGVAALAAGVGYLTYEMLQSSKASQQFAATVNQAFTQSSATDFMTQVPQLAAQGMDGLTSALHDNTRAWVPLHVAANQAGQDFAKFAGVGSRGVLDSLGALGDGLMNAGKAAGDFFSGMVHGQQAMNSVSNYTGAITTLDQGQKNLLQDADSLIKQGYSVSDSFALMDVAGVKASDSFAVATEKIKNLINGYKNLSVAGPALANSVNAVTFASEQQDSKISALTQGWTTFIGTVTGGESSFASFAQQIQGTAAAAGGAQASLSDSNGKVSDSIASLSAAATGAKTSITGLSADSLNLRESFTQAVTQGSALYNSLVTMASAAGLGAKGTQMLSQAGKDMVAQLLPLTQGSKAAVAELYALAQQAGYNGPDAFKALAQWVGNVHDPMKQLDSITAQLTQDSANLAQDVKNLADAIGQNLNQAMATAIFQASGGQKTFDAFATALHNTHETSDGLRTAAQNMAAQLIEVMGNTKSAQSEFVVLAGAMGLSQGKATALWDSIESGAAQAAASVQSHAAAIAAALAGIPSQKTISIIENFAVTGSGSGVSGTNARVLGAAAGWRVPGYGGGDHVPAMLEPGEAVVPKHLVPAVAPFLGAHHVPGFAEGGMAGRRGSWDMADVAEIWAREIWGHDLRGHGRGHPLAANAAEALLHAVTQPKHLTGLWGDPLYRDLEGILRADIGPYERRDLLYWKLSGERASLSRSEAAAVAHFEREIRLHEQKKEPGWARYYERQMSAVEHSDSAKLAAWAHQLKVLERQGFSAGGLARSYDSGGYLPVGLSVAYNGTGRPEPVGGGGTPVVHVHLHGDLADDAMWERMQVRTLDYNYYNTGQPTGKVLPGR